MARFSEKLLSTKCVFRFSLQLLSETLFILKETSEISKTYIGLHVKHPLFFSVFMKTEFLYIVSKKRQTSNFMNIRPVGVELFLANR